MDQRIGRPRVEILEIDPPQRLVQSFHVTGDDPAAAEPPSAVTWELAPIEAGTRLHLTHDGQGDATLAYTESGWEYILGGLKALLESSDPRRPAAEPV